MKIFQLEIKEFIEVHHVQGHSSLKKGKGYFIKFDEKRYDDIGNDIWRHFGLPVDNIYSNTLDNVDIVRVSCSPDMSLSKEAVVGYMSGGEGTDDDPEYVSGIVISTNYTRFFTKLFEEWKNRDQSQPFYLYLCTTKDFLKSLMDHIIVNAAGKAYLPHRLIRSGAADKKELEERWGPINFGFKTKGKKSLKNPKKSVKKSIKKSKKKSSLRR